MELEQLDLAELKQLQRDVNKAIDSFEKRKKAEALKALEQVAAAHGVKLSDMLRDVPSGRSKVEPKYRHPDNAEITWSGRGRKPRWLADALDAGAKLADFEI